MVKQFFYRNKKIMKKSNTYFCFYVKVIFNNVQVQMWTQELLWNGEVRKTFSMLVKLFIMDVQMDFCYKVTLTGLALKMECGLGKLQIANIMIVQP